MSEKDDFNVDLVKGYPQANKKISLDVQPYSIVNQDAVVQTDEDQQAITTFVSPFGMEFTAPKDYPTGTLLKINLSLPDYWDRKKKFVEYTRIDVPSELRILAKVVRTEDVGKRKKKKLVLVQTVNIDEIDEQVLKTYLEESK